MTVPSDDDPEQRIRDLERSGSVAPAGAVESSSRRALRAGWALLGLLVLALAAGGAVILAERRTHTVPGAATAPADPRSPIPPARTGLPTPVSPVAPVPPTPAPVPVPTVAPPGADVSVAGVDTRRSITCTDNAVTVSGVNNTVVITGRCRRVDVSGLENVVTVDESASIAVSGLNNVVTYRAGTPQLSESGIGNTLARG